MPAKRKTQHLDEETQASAAPGGGNLSSNQLGANTSSSDAHLREQLEILTNSSAPNSNVPVQAFARGAGSEASQPVTSPPTHGFANGTVSSPPDALASITNDPEAHIHPDLRARTAFAPVSGMMSSGIPASAGSPSLATPGPSAVPPQPLLHQQPDISAQIHPDEDTDMGMDQGAGSAADGRKAKRELSQSKRAAQNRAAQRAFRQRKEGYIKKLEQQVRDFTEMETGYKHLQSENYALREYVIHLQSRLVDTQGEYPQPPPNLNLAQVGPPAPSSQEPQGLGPHVSPGPPGTDSSQVAIGSVALPTEPLRSNPPSAPPLDAVAQAVAGLAAQEQLAERQQYPVKDYGTDAIKQDRRDAEELDSQMQQDGLSAPTASM